MSLVVYPSGVREDGTGLVIYTGTADRSVDWRLTGAGTLTAITTYTNHNGQAAALYTPAGGSPGMAGTTVTIEVEAGA